MIPKELYVVFIFRLMQDGGKLTGENLMMESDHEPSILELRYLEKTMMKQPGVFSAAVTGWKRVPFPEGYTPDKDNMIPDLRLKDEVAYVEMDKK